MENDLKTIQLTLPYPISANRYWRSFSAGKRVVTVPSAEAKDYKQSVQLIAQAAGVRAPITGRVHIHLQLFPNRPQDWQKRMRQHGASWDDTVQCIDLDNARKVLYDSLKGVAIEDDKWVRSDSGERMEPDGEARVVVTITALQVEQPQVALFEEA
jgi:crossover junction endodeoxyribonuclease RusA